MPLTPQSGGTGYEYQPGFISRLWSTWSLSQADENDNDNWMDRAHSVSTAPPHISDRCRIDLLVSSSTALCLVSKSDRSGSWIHSLNDQINLWMLWLNAGINKLVSNQQVHHNSWITKIIIFFFSIYQRCIGMIYKASVRKPFIKSSTSGSMRRTGRWPLPLTYPLINRAAVLAFSINDRSISDRFYPRWWRRDLSSVRKIIFFKYYHQQLTKEGRCSEK